MSGPDALLPAYDTSNLVHGDVVRGKLVSGALFSAMTLREEEVEIEVPSLAGHVLTVAPEPRPAVRFRFEGRKQDARLHSGFMSLMPQGLSPWWSSDGCGGRMTHVHFTPDADMRLFGDVPKRALRAVAPSPDPVVRQMVELIVMDDDRVGSETLLGDSIAGALLCHLHRAYGNDVAMSPAGKLAPWQLRCAIEILAASIADDLRLETLAAEVRLSPFHFARAFKASTGLPPHRYLVQLRLDRARDLLEASDATVTDIAAAVGYDDPGYFTRLFRREVGMTPSLYRRDRRT